MNGLFTLVWLMYNNELERIEVVVFCYPKKRTKYKRVASNVDQECLASLAMFHDIVSKVYMDGVENGIFPSP